jgi:superfamily II DNA or RNA helicase
VRRLGHPALVLCPTQTIQRQWADQQELFGGVSDEVKLLTYQSLCQASDPDGMLRGAAERHWAFERAGVTGQQVAEVEAEVTSWSGAAAAQRDRELSALVARFKKEAAAGEREELAARDLLSDNARERLHALSEAGVCTVVLDECHHLVSLWGALLRIVLDEMRPTHVLGLTATTPTELSAAEAKQYTDLLGDVDFFIPTPAVVKDGYLAPYQELVQLCEPLVSEREWLDERHARFSEALIALDDLPPEAEHLGLSVWLLARLRDRDAGDGAALSWAEFARRSPRLADAGLRWLHTAGHSPPEGAPRGERTRAPLSIDDWVVMLEDYAMRCLRADASPVATERLEQLQVALRDLGFAVTRQGIRRVGGEVDRVLVNSAAKPIAMCDALATEYDARGEGLRAVVLCDTEHPPKVADDSPLLLSGGGRGLLAAVAEDERLIGLRPALITSQTFAVLDDDVEWWRSYLGLPEFTTTPGDGITLLAHTDLDSRAWTAAVTRALSEGGCRLLVGTRGLLGEGWDCPELNVLIDMTAVAADISVRQMRGRSLRLDPRDRSKLSSNWDVVCVAPELGRGHADYDRFVRRHSHLHAPCEDGAIETGPSHVHPELSPYGPPDAARFAPINAEQRERSAERDAARERWRIGEPYVGTDVDVLVVRRPRGGYGPGGAVEDLDARPPRRRSLVRAPIGLAGGGVALGAVAALASPLLLLGAAGLLAAAWWQTRRGNRRARRWFPRELPLEWAAGAVRDAYVELGELPAGTELRFDTRPEGWIRVSAPSAPPEVATLISAGLDEVLGNGGLPRYFVSRFVAEGLRKRHVSWHPVPSELATHRSRADAFFTAWQQWCGPGELVYGHGDRGRELVTDEDVIWETQRRRIWR